MSKYIKEKITNKTRNILWITGILEIGLYLFASFPGTRLFGSIPIKPLCMYLLLFQSIVVFALAIKNGIYATTHFIWYGMFAIISMLSLTLSGGSIANGGLYAILICFALTTVQAFYISNEKAFRIVFWSYIIACMVNSAFLLVSGSLTLREGERLGYAINVNPNLLATYLMYGILYSIWLFCFEKQKRIKWLLVLIACFIMYPLMLTGGRKFFLSPIIFFSIVYIIKNRNQEGHGWIKGLLFITVLFIVIWQLIMNTPALYNSLGYRVEGLINAITGSGKVDSSTQERDEMRKLAIESWLYSPIWGQGFDNFKYISRQKGMAFAYSHCNYTELLCNGGLISFIVYYWFYGMILWKSITDKRIDIKFRALGIAGIITQMVFDYGGVMYNGYDTQLFILLIFCSMKGFNNSSLISW